MKSKTVLQNFNSDGLRFNIDFFAIRASLRFFQDKVRNSFFNCFGKHVLPFFFNNPMNYVNQLFKLITTAID